MSILSSDALALLDQGCECSVYSYKSLNHASTRCLVESEGSGMNQVYQHIITHTCGGHYDTAQA